MKFNFRFLRYFGPYFFLSPCVPAWSFPSHSFSCNLDIKSSSRVLIFLSPISFSLIIGLRSARPLMCFPHQWFFLFSVQSSLALLFFFLSPSSFSRSIPIHSARAFMSSFYSPWPSFMTLFSLIFFQILSKLILVQLLFINEIDFFPPFCSLTLWM